MLQTNESVSVETDHLDEESQEGRKRLYLKTIQFRYKNVGQYSKAISRSPGGSCPGSRVRSRAGGSRSRRTRPRGSACPATAGWPSPAAAAAWSPPGRR